MEYDEILKLIGEFGKYQKRLYFIICLIAFPATFNNMGYVFWAARLDHWCEVERPDIQVYRNMSNEEWRDLTVPKVVKNCGGLSEEDGCANGGSGEIEYDSCYRYADLELNSTLQNQQNSSEHSSAGDRVTAACESWSYDTTVYKSSIVTQYQLVCDRQWLRSISQSLYFTSRIGGTLGIGALADRIGRRKTILISVLFQVIFSIAIAFAPDIYSFIVFRCLCAAFSTGSFQTTYVLVMELVGPSWRVFAGTGIMVYWAVAYVILAVIAYFIRDHFILQLVVSVPFTTFVFYYWIIPESPRWLIAKDRKDEAMGIISTMAKVNNKELPEKKDILLLPSEKQNESSRPLRDAVCDSLKSPYLWRMNIVLFLIWFTDAVVYYGLSLNSSDLGGNDFFNFFIAGAVEIPAYILCYFAFTKLGRRWPLMCVMLLAGISLLATACIPKDINAAVVALATLGKFSITCSYSMIYIYATELYPTTIRNIGLGVCSTMSRFGGIIAPFASDLDVYYPGLPLILFGILSTISGLSVLTLPETKDKPLPQTLEDGRRLAHQSTIISKCCSHIPCTSQKSPSESPSAHEQEILPNGENC